MRAGEPDLPGKADRVRHLYLLLIVVAGVIGYSNTFQVPFQFDDIANILINPLIRNTGLLFDPAAYCSHVGPQSIDYVTCYFFKKRYLGYLSFAANYFVHGFRVEGYHAFNLAVHILNGLLVYFFVRLMFRTPVLSRFAGSRHATLVALFSSLLFVSHPVQTQAVTYIVQRFTSLATMFYLLSVVMYVKFRILATPDEASRARASRIGHRASDIWYFASLFSVVLAMKTKEIAFTAPLMIALCEFGFMEGSLKGRVRFLGPVLSTMLIIPLSFVDMNKPLMEITRDISFAARVKTDMPRADYLYTQFPVVATYVRLILLPLGQNLDYDFPVYRSFFVPSVAGSFLFLAALTTLGISLWLRSGKADPRLRLVSFGIFWFFITLSVESSFIPIVDVIFEHRIYLPSVGAFLAITTALFILTEKIETRWRPARKTMIAFFVGIVLILTGATLIRNTVWQNEFTLWEDVVRKSPGKARGYNNLGYFHMQGGRYEEAIGLFGKALERDPNYLQTHNNLGNIYLALGRFERAVENFTRSIEIDPRYADIYNNRGNAYMGLNAVDEAIADYSKAIALLPVDADYYFNRGIARMKRKEYGEATTDFSKAAALNPRHSGAFLQRGMATYLSSPNWGGALPDFQRACELGNGVACQILGSGPGPGNGR